MVRIRLIGKHVLEIMSHNQDFVSINILLILKIIFFSISVGLNFEPIWMIISSLATLLFLSVWCIFLPKFARISFLILFNGLISVALLADLLFYRFFHNFISVPILFQIREAKGVSSSIATLFSKWDFLLFVDLLFLVPYLIRLKPTHLSHSPAIRKRLSHVGVLLIVIGFTLGLTTKTMALDFNQNAYTGLNWNNTVLLDMGPVNYHIYDIYNYFNKNKATKLLTDDIDSLKAWMASNRSQKTHNFTAVAQGKNVIIVQMEAMQNFLVGRAVNGQEITPNLNRLVKSSMYFDNYFTQIGEGNTSDAEFMTLNSLYPAASGSNNILRDENAYQALPSVLRQVGYGSYVFHSNDPEFWNRANMFKAEGFDKFYNKNDLEQDERVGMGLSDVSMLKQVAKNLAEFKQPFFSFAITLSGHYPYNLPDSKKELTIPQDQYSQTFANYLQAQHYADKALGEFVDSLKNQGLLDNSVLVVYGDHYGTGWTNRDIETFLGLNQKLNNYSSLELNKVPLLIHLPGGASADVKHISGGQMDLYPTLVNLLGLNKNDLFYFGQDLLNTKQGFSAFRVWTPDGSFATDDIFYISKDGQFEHGSAYNRKTGEKIGLEGLEDNFKKANRELLMSDLILQTNGLPKLVSLSQFTASESTFSK